MKEKSYIDDLILAYEALSQKGHQHHFEEEAFLQLIDYFAQQNQINRAIQVAAHAFETYPFSLELALRKIELLLDTYQVHDALQTIHLAEHIAPYDAELSLQKAKTLAMQGDYLAANALLDQLKSTASTDLLTDIFLLEAFIFEQSEEYEAMFYTLKNAILENPTSEEALYKFGICIELTKKFEESILFHQELLDRNAYAAQAWYNLGQAYAYLGDYLPAIEAYEFAIVSNEHFEQAYRDVADLCFEVQQFRKAVKWYEELLEQFEPEAEVYFKIGACNQRLGRTTIARTFFQQSLTLDPFNDEVYFAIAESYQQERNWQLAVSNYQKAITIENNREEYFGALAHAYVQLDELEAAETNFQKAIDIAPEQPEYWVSYASFLLLEDRAADAFDLLEEADEYTTGAALTYIKIACLFIEGRRQEAFYWLGEALMEDYQLYTLLFKLCPELQHDNSVLNLISSYAS
ncbi:MAG: tetratricopeptide repeat protein [Bacteroidota bacterium]